MRLWLFHPLIFYPLAALLAAFVVVVSVKPQSWPRAPAPVAGEIAGGAIVLDGAAFNSPAVGPEQRVTVVRDFWGRPLTLRIAHLPGQPPPTPAEQGARILLDPERAALIDNKPVLVEVSYRPIPINTATGLAVSLQGAGPADWVSQPAPPQAGTLRFSLPARLAANAIGVRAFSDWDDQTYGLEITRIRITPQAAASAAN